MYISTPLNCEYAYRVLTSQLNKIYTVFAPKSKKNCQELITLTNIIVGS